MLATEIKFKNFSKALAALEVIYMKPVSEDRVYIDGTIQRFEFTFETCWKFLKSYFFDQGLELNSPKAVIREAYAFHFIDNEKLWLDILSDHNMTSHTYNEKLADEIYMRIRDYVPEFKRLLQALTTQI